MRSSSRVACAVACSAAAIAATSDAGRRSRRPITISFTPCAMSSAVSLRRYRANRRMSVDTSAAGRLQLSEEKAYKLSAVMPQPGAISTTRRTAAAPARWPAARGSPRRVAQRPLPSMTMATWKEVLCFIKSPAKKKMTPSACARRANQRFHVIEIALERPPSEGGESVLRLGDAARERLVARDVLGVFELPRMDAEVAVGRFEQRLQLVECDAVTHRERADDREPHALVNQPVQVRRGGLDFRLSWSFRVCAGNPRRTGLSHRTSVQ